MIRKLLIGAFVAFIFGVTSFGIGPHPASAKVDENVVIEIPPRNFGDNPCEPGIYPVTLSGFRHQVIKTQNGETTTHWNTHLSGEDTKGVKYEINFQIDFDGLPVAGTPWRLVQHAQSQGPVSNRMLTVEGLYLMPPTTFDSVCRG